MEGELTLETVSVFCCNSKVLMDGKVRLRRDLLAAKELAKRSKEEEAES